MFLVYINDMTDKIILESYMFTVNVTIRNTAGSYKKISTNLFDGIKSGIHGKQLLSNKVQGRQDETEIVTQGRREA